jgi:hypothetical protein
MGKLDFPVFDADNHLYETEDAFTRHLPAEHEGLFKYVQVNGRTKIAVDNVISVCRSNIGSCGLSCGYAA